jgi:hypothetical protein
MGWAKIYNPTHLPIFYFLPNLTVMLWASPAWSTSMTRDIKVIFIKERKVNLHIYADQDIGAFIVNTQLFIGDTN